MMKVNEIKDIIDEYHLSEISGIATMFIMAVVSFVPVVGKHDINQLVVVCFFLALSVLRLILFLWNRKVEGTETESCQQAKMMLFSSIVLLLIHAVSVSAVFYQMFVKEEIPVMASIKILAIVYGVYAIIKIIISLHNISVKRKMNLYAETLAYLGWISAIYTLSLFTNYLLIAKKAYEYNWPRYIMISYMGLMVLIFAVIMMVRSIPVLRERK